MKSKIKFLFYERLGECEQKAEIQGKLVNTIRNRHPKFSVGYIFCIAKKPPKLRVCHSNPSNSSKDMDRNGRLHAEEERSQTKQPRDNKTFLVLTIIT